MLFQFIEIGRLSLSMLWLQMFFYQGQAVMGFFPLVVCFHFYVFFMKLNQKSIKMKHNELSL